MAEVTVKQLADMVGVSVERLQEQMLEAGIDGKNASSSVSEAERQSLLNHLKRSHGESAEAGEPKKITLKRKTTSQLKVAGASGKKKMVNVEVRKKRTYIKRSEIEPDQVDDQVNEEAMVDVQQVEEQRQQQEAEQARLAREEAEAKAQAEAKAKAEAEAKAKEEAEAKAKAEAELKKTEENAARKKAQPAAGAGAGDADRSSKPGWTEEKKKEAGGRSGKTRKREDGRSRFDDDDREGNRRAGKLTRVRDKKRQAGYQ